MYFKQPATYTKAAGYIPANLYASYRQEFHYLAEIYKKSLPELAAQETTLNQIIFDEKNDPLVALAKVTEDDESGNLDLVFAKKFLEFDFPDSVDANRARIALGVIIAHLSDVAVQARKLYDLKMNLLREPRAYAGSAKTPEDLKVDQCLEDGFGLRGGPAARPDVQSPFVK
mgnify:CR=1 FL=1